MQEVHYHYYGVYVYSASDRELKHVSFSTPFLYVRSPSMFLIREEQLGSYLEWLSEL
jgi:hypothetical protein